MAAAAVAALIAEESRRRNRRHRPTAEEEETRHPITRWSESGSVLHHLIPSLSVFFSGF
jgi:hypothetical protein